MKHYSRKETPCKVCKIVKGRKETIQVKSGIKSGLTPVTTRR